MNSCKKILSFCALFFAFLCGQAQNNSISGELVLFTDKEFCISGDTLWFKVKIPTEIEKRNNVVHVQLDSNTGNPIANVAKICKNGWAEGFIHIPDSLSSGLYFVSPFINIQRNEKDFTIHGKTLFVYNRFENGIAEFPVPDENGIKKTEAEKAIQIITEKLKYNTREQVSGKVSIQNKNIKNAIITARLVDPLSHALGGRVDCTASGVYPEIPQVEEKNGLILSGFVKDEENRPVKNELVLLSISEEPPYFDYCVTGENGDYHFFLKEARGTAGIVMQTASENYGLYKIHPCFNTLQLTCNLPVNQRILTKKESDFIGDFIKGNFINKLFNPSPFSYTDDFYKPQRFEFPFYGPPEKRIIPDEFFDLPDFKEISRELLPGLQYREKNGEVYFRMICPALKMIFENEPLRLLNGVPIFKNSLLTSLKSTDIAYIDLIQNERVFGDLVFMGIMAVSLRDKSNLWMAQQSNIFQFDIPCLQPDKEPHNSTGQLKATEPDIRQVYLWKTLNVDTTNTFNFNLSDFKGNVEIVVEGITSDNKPVKTSRIIEVE